MHYAFSYLKVVALGSKNNAYLAIVIKNTRNKDDSTSVRYTLNQNGRPTFELQVLQVDATEESLDHEVEGSHLDICPELIDDEFEEGKVAVVFALHQIQADLRAVRRRVSRPFYLLFNYY